MPLEDAFGFFRLELRSPHEDEYPALADLSYFLQDLNLLYEFCRVTVDPVYRDYHFTRFFLYRNRHRIDDKDQLRIERLRHESPFVLITIVAAVPSAAAALWAFTQAFEKIMNLKLNREILTVNRDVLVLNREKLRRELAKAPDGHVEPRDRNIFAEVLQTKNRVSSETQALEPEQIYEKLEKRLGEGPIRIREIDLTYLNELPPQPNR